MSFCQCHAEELYVRVSTGEYFFGSDYIESGHTEDELSNELASGSVVREGDWLKKHLPEAEPNPVICKAQIEAAAKLAMNSAYGFPRPKAPDPKVAYESYSNFIKDIREESNEKTNVQSHRTPLRSEGDMPVRPDQSARCSARTQPEESKREVRYMCGLIFAAIVVSLLWLLYY